MNQFEFIKWNFIYGKLYMFGDLTLKLFIQEIEILNYVSENKSDIYRIGNRKVNILYAFGKTGVELYI